MRSAAAATDGFEPPPLDDVQQRVLQSLREDGIALVPFHDLFEERLWSEAVADIEPFIRETEETMPDLGDRPSGKDEMFARRFYGKRKRTVFSFRDPMLRIAASEPILDIVNSYTGQWRRLSYLDNWFTRPYPNSDTRIATQRWHRDPNDPHVVKVFIYFSDVDEEAGPFEYVRSSSSGGRYGHLWPWGEEERYPPPDELEAAVTPEDRMAATGPSGTVILCDTGGFHRGGFARTKPRILLVSVYLPRDGKKGKRRFDVDLEGREEALPPQVRLALS
jgi:hypothetical protein